MQTLDNKTALITGGSKGIGFGIAAALVAQNMNVAITSRTRQAAEEAAQKLNEMGRGQAIGLAADVRHGAEQLTAVDEMLHKWGKLDVLVANAGLGHFVPIEEMTEDQWHETIDTNLTGVFHSIKASIPAL